MADKQSAKPKEEEVGPKKATAEDTPKKTVAKAGKRSAKAIEAAAAEVAKEERKNETIAKTNKSQPKKTEAEKTHTRLERRSKAYRQKESRLEKNKSYSLDEASQIISQTNPVKFDATIELHLRLNVDPRLADQNIRDSVLLPAGSGKSVRVAAFVDGDDLTSAAEAGADLVGEENVIKELEAGSFSFDVLVATPTQMPKLGKYARLLGPRGLMPNPKSGTVTTDVAKAIKESKAGKVEYRIDSGGNIHLPIGKVSFSPADILKNLTAVTASITANKPASVKGVFILSGHLSTSMGPALKLAL